MKILLWIGQLLLAALFANAGYMKLVTPIDTLAESMGWVLSFPDWGVRALAIAELLGAVGLILPVLTGIARVLTPVAASALAVVMAGAIVTHAMRGEFAALPMPVAAMVVSAAVAWGWFHLLGRQSEGETHAG